MHSGTALSTFMIHTYHVNDQKLHGYALMKAWLDNVIDEFDLSVMGPGELTYFIGDRMAHFPGVRDKMMQALYAILSSSAQELAIELEQPPEAFDEVVDALADVFMLEVNLVYKLRSNQYYFHEKRHSKLPPKMAKKHHKHPKLERELEKLLAHLQEDDQLYAEMVEM
jgi:hypothetical protein